MPAILAIEAPADCRLRIHANQFATTQRVDADLEGRGTRRAIHFDDAAPAHEERENLVVRQFCFGHHPKLPLRLAHGKGRMDEVQVARVVDRDHRSAGTRYVLGAGSGDRQTL